jgi:AcrR family transcriptional regulator
MRTADPARVQRVIDAAAQLFARRPYHEVRMEDIAAQAGVAKGTLYLHFKTKEDLYLALIVNGMQRLFEEVREKVGRPGTAEERLRVFVREGIRFFDRQPYVMDLIQRMEASGAGVESVPALQEKRAAFLGLLTEILGDFNASGRFAEVDAELAARALVGMMRELLRFRPPPRTDRLAEWIVNQFLHGICRPR